MSRGYNPQLFPTNSFQTPSVGPSYDEGFIASQRLAKIGIGDRNSVARMLALKAAVQCFSPSLKAHRCGGLLQLLRCDRSLAASP